jgi:hypothetical protein
MGSRGQSLIPDYRELHRQGKFPGYSIVPYVPRISEIVIATGAQTLLDYGSGEGKQYHIARVHDAWGGIMPTLYDPAVPGLDTRPVGKFDAVISTDVLEHVPRQELRAVIADIYRYARLWCFITVCCRPAKPNKKLLDGRNVHVTVQPKAWWLRRLITQAPRAGPALFMDFTP